MGAMATLDSGKTLPPLVDTPQAGAAEVLYGLGAAIGRRGGEDLGLVYLQLALYLAPNQPLALLSLADLYEPMKKPAARDQDLSSACREVRRCSAMPTSSSPPISTRSNAPTRPSSGSAS